MKKILMIVALAGLFVGAGCDSAPKEGEKAPAAPSTNSAPSTNK